MQSLQRKDFFQDLCEEEGFIAKRKSDIKKKKGSKAPPNCRGSAFGFIKPKYVGNKFSGIKFQVLFHEAKFILIIFWATGLMLGQAFSFVDLVACDAVTETEANQVDLNSLKIPRIPFVHVGHWWT